MKGDEVDSQLSAMFDGELPAAECELLSRRIDRDENLRARWARYVLIGASMRFEPVATASASFAARVSAAVAADAAAECVVAAPTAPVPQRRFLWQTALAAALVSAVAGLSISMLRSQAISTAVIPTASVPAAAGALEGSARAEFARASGPSTVVLLPDAREPRSYVTPGEHLNTSMALRSELADYIVAHSEYSAPLMRPDLLSALVSGEDGLDKASSNVGAPGASPGAGESDAATAATAAHP